MKLRISALVATLALAATTAIASDTFVIDPGHSEASFKVRHMLSKTPGRFRDFEGRIHLDPARPEASVVEFKIRAASIDTDLDKRDEHLRGPDFFEVAKYPEITFRSESIRRTGKDRYDVTGPLTMRGVTRKITLPVTYLGVARDPWGNERAGFSTAITLSRKDFGMVWNKVLDQGGVFLGDEVWVTVEIEAAREKAAS